MYLNVANKDKQLNADQDEADGIDAAIRTDICYICMKKCPPPKGKGKGKGKSASARQSRNIKWAGCDQCERWYHCVCLGSNIVEDDAFICTFCK